jgi:hypothetical protein
MIHKKFLFLLILFLPFTLIGQFDLNKHVAGPSLGFSFLGSALQYGINHEYSFNMEDIGIDSKGKLGIGGILRYWNYSENFTHVKWDYSNVLIGVQSNYHFYMANDHIDPWFGIIFAYNVGSTDTEIKIPSISIEEDSHDGFWLAANAGIRYWINENIALSIRIGFGTLSYSGLDLGFDYKF